MSRRAKSKAELLESIRSTRFQLDGKFAQLAPQQLVWPGSMDNWGELPAVNLDCGQHIQSLQLGAPEYSDDRDSQEL